MDTFKTELEQFLKLGKTYSIAKAFKLTDRLCFKISKSEINKYNKQITTACYSYIEDKTKQFLKTDDFSHLFQAFDSIKELDYLSFNDSSISEKCYYKSFKKIETALFKYNINIKTNSHGDDLVKIIETLGLKPTEEGPLKNQLLLMTENIDNLKCFQKEFYFGLWFFLYVDADKILKEHKEINFDHYADERASAIKKLGLMKGKYNSEKFYSYLEKIIKNGKPILALHIMNSFSDISFIQGTKSLCNFYIDAVAKLERFDILEKFYGNFEILNQNLVFLENIAKYYISQRKCNKALEIVTKMSKIEPKYHFIEESKNSIERCMLIEKLSSKNIDNNKINALSGHDFESLIINKFREYGFDAKETPITGDYGADIIVENKNQTRFVIQCKRFKTKVNLKAVQEVTAALAHFNGDIGIVVTNNSFLNSAIKLAESNDIELWDSIKLMKFLAGDISFSSIYE